MTVWVMVICGGLTGWGCGSISTGEFASKADCLEALSSVRFDVDTAGENRMSAYAYCKPKKEEKID